MVVVNPGGRESEGVALDKDRQEWKVLDESIKMDFENIGSIHQGDFFIIDRDNADATWIVAFTVDDGPVPFYAYVGKAQKATFLFDNPPDLNKYTLAKMAPVSFTSTERLTLYRSLTRPPA